MIMNKNLQINNISLSTTPSKWIKNNLSKNVKDRTLLNIACGNGRHSIYAASLGYKVISLDINKEKISLLEQKIYQQLVQSLTKFIAPIQINAQLIAKLDCLYSFAFISKKYNYKKYD